MTADPVDGESATARRNKPDLAAPVRVVQDLALFARRNGLDEADALLTELLAVLYAQSG